MNIECGIWWRTEDSEDGASAQGELLVETAGDESIIVHFRVNGEIIANAELDRFMAGALTGQLMHAASEAVAA